MTNDLKKMPRKDKLIKITLLKKAENKIKYLSNNPIKDPKNKG